MKRITVGLIALMILGLLVAPLPADAPQRGKMSRIGYVHFGQRTPRFERSKAAFFQLVERLARHFVDRHGAPNLGTALPPAREEADYAMSLCDHKTSTLLAIEREPGEAGIVERIRVIRPERARDHAKIWEIMPDEEPGPGEAVT